MSKTQELVAKAEKSGKREYAGTADGWAVSCRISRAGNPLFMRHTLTDAKIARSDVETLLR
jgi:hypothetical protein